MLKSLRFENFTVFQDADFTFGDNLNVIVGENGSGKSHALKAAYVAIAVSAERAMNGGVDQLSKSQLQKRLAEKLLGVFRPDGIWRLVRRQQGRGKCRVTYVFNEARLNLKFTFSTVARTEVTVETTPTVRIEKLPIFLPTRELLTISPGFVTLYETTYNSFEETWRDTCLLLGALLARGPRESRIKQLLAPLEAAMGGRVDKDESGRFYLNTAAGNMEMHLVAEGLRKLATVARLIATGSLLDKGYLFWDEPESNLNPKIIKIVAKTILQIAASGIQVFIASHSLFLIRELDVLLQGVEFKAVKARFFGLHRTDGGYSVKQGDTIDDIGEIDALQEELSQSDRYLDSEGR